VVICCFGAFFRFRALVVAHSGWWLEADVKGSDWCAWWLAMMPV